MKILITGAGGFIGTALSKFLVRDNAEYEIFCLVRKKNKNFESIQENLRIIEADLQSNNFKKKLPKKIDTIIHLAGNSKTFLTSFESRKQFSTNLDLTSNLLDYSEKAKPSKLIFASSVYVYSGGNQIPFVETSQVMPSESLGASKLASEALFKSFSFSNNIDTLSLRLFTVYGPGSRKEQFIPQAIKKILSKKNPVSFGNPSVKRDFIFIDDVLEAFRLAIKKDLKRCFKVINVGSGKAYSIESIVYKLKEILNAKKEVKFAKESKKDKNADSDHLADISSAKSYLDWSPKVGIQKGLRVTVDSIRK